MDLCYDVSLCYIFSLYEGAGDGKGGYSCRFQVPVKFFYFLRGRGARTLVRFNHFILRTFQQNTSRYVTLCGGMCNLEVGPVCGAKTSPFYHFFLQIRMWKLETGGLLFPLCHFTTFLFRSWRRLAVDCGSLDQEVFSLQGLRQYFQVIFFTRFVMCYW